MTKTIQQIFLIVTLAFSQYLYAAKEESIVWVAPGITLENTRAVRVIPTSNDSGKEGNEEAAYKITQAIKNELKNVGLTIIDADKDTQKQLVSLKASLINFETGSAGGRWLGFGKGAATCIIRTAVISEETGETIAEIISAKVLDAGGFFTLGADVHIPEGVAKLTTDELLKLFGRQSSEE